MNRISSWPLRKPSFWTRAPSAAELEVKLLNKGTAGLGEDRAGDTVKFVATDKGHNAQTIKGIAPEGTAAFQGKNGEDTVVKFDPGRRLPREMPAALRHGYGDDDLRRGTLERGQGQGCSAGRQGEAGVRDAVREAGREQDRFEVTGGL